MVSWEPVKATDNDQATVFASPDVTSPHEFTEGSHTVLFTAVDESQNTKLCLFKVNVQGRQSLLLVRCRAEKKKKVFTTGGNKSCS